ncbi:CBP80/20-dependent translation initiation factor isoform X2 [Dermacentor silvarum]|uniref:CBP80/20-dependent translation initiation factor isoform X2 n=1 Tax=Dermacentor silvarum TaxID=543639 RepID=UPI00210115F0|nr:CBP80/20-dependent translation initiation factor isoform X2 [Dermacentor silvarum]
MKGTLLLNGATTALIRSSATGAIGRPEEHRTGRRQQIWPLVTSEPPANQEVLPLTRGGAESACDVKPLSDTAGTAASTPQPTSTATAEPLNRAPPSSTRASGRRKRQQRRKPETSTSEGVDRSLSGHEASRKEEQDPDSLTPEQVDRLVRVVCGKAINDDDSAETAAKFCASVIAKERAGLFIDRLLCTCRNWLKQRDLLLPNFTTTALGEPPQEQKDSHRWAAFVSFLAGLLTAIPGKGKRSAVGTCHSGHIFCLAALLCESCKFIIHSPDLEWHTQIECLRSALKTAGKTAERAAPARMAALVACLRDEFLTPDASAETRLTLLELIELRASGWKFSAQQQLYYAAHSGVFGAECDDDLSPLPLPCRTAQ